MSSLVPKATFATPTKPQTGSGPAFAPASHSVPSFSFGAAAAQNSGFSFSIKQTAEKKEEDKKAEKVASPVKGGAGEEEDDGEDSYYKVTLQLCQVLSSSCVCLDCEIHYLFTTVRCISSKSSNIFQIPHPTGGGRRQYLFRTHRSSAG